MLEGEKQKCYKLQIKALINSGNNSNYFKVATFFIAQIADTIKGCYIAIYDL